MDLYFIKNIEDYYNYKKLRPVHFYRKQKVQFICSQCHQLKTKVFVNLTESFICKNCSCHNVAIKTETKEKRKKTCKEKYGFEIPMQSDKIKEKMYNTNEEKYGTKIFSKSKFFKDKAIETNLEKYRY